MADDRYSFQDSHAHSARFSMFRKWDSSDFLLPQPWSRVPSRGPIIRRGSLRGAKHDARSLSSIGFFFPSRSTLDSYTRSGSRCFDCVWPVLSSWPDYAEKKKTSVFAPVLCGRDDGCAGAGEVCAFLFTLFFYREKHHIDLQT